MIFMYNTTRSVFLPWTHPCGSRIKIYKFSGSITESHYFVQDKASIVNYFERMNPRHELQFNPKLCIYARDVRTMWAFSCRMDKCLQGLKSIKLDEQGIYLEIRKFSMLDYIFPGVDEYRPLQCHDGVDRRKKVYWREIITEQFLPIEVMFGSHAYFSEKSEKYGIVVPNSITIGTMRTIDICSKCSRPYIPDITSINNITEGD